MSQMSVASEGRAEAAGLLQGLWRWGTGEPIANPLAPAPAQPLAAPAAPAPNVLPAGGNILPAIGSYIDLYFESETKKERFSIPGTVIAHEETLSSFTARPLHDDGGSEYDESIECHMLGRNDAPEVPLAGDQQEWTPRAFDSSATVVQHVLDSAKAHCQRNNFDSKVRNLLVGGYVRVPEANVRFTVGLAKPKKAIAAMKRKEELEAHISLLDIEGQVHRRPSKKKIDALLVQLAPSAGALADLDHDLDGDQQEVQGEEEEVEGQESEEDEVDVDVEDDAEGEAAAAEEEASGGRRVRPRLQAPAAAAQVDDLDARLQAAEAELAQANVYANACKANLVDVHAHFLEVINDAAAEQRPLLETAGAGTTLEARLEASSVTLNDFSGVPQLYSELKVARDELQAARVDLDVKEDAKAKLRAARDAQTLRELAEAYLASMERDAPDPTPNPRHSETAQASYARFVADFQADLKAAKADLDTRREEEAAAREHLFALAPRAALLAGGQP